jgi:RsiW-degrading membrane proteinase PrsW (M82 family)
MAARRSLALIIVVPFALLTAYAVAQVGYIGIFDYHRHSPAGWQVFTDLVIALVLVLSWLIPEARRAGHNPWPWVVVTLFLGSFGPLLYLVFVRVDNTADRRSGQVAQHAG